MNGKFLKVSLLLISSSALFIAGCGPQNLNDADYLAQTANGEILSKSGGDQGPHAGGPDSAQAPQMGGGEQGQQMAPPAGGDQQGPQMGAPAGRGEQMAPPAGGGGGGGCPSGNCEVAPIPDSVNNVQLPDQVLVQPTKVIPTGEKQISTHTTNYHTRRFIHQPAVRQHRVLQHMHRIARYFQEDNYLPSYRRENFVYTNTSSAVETTPIVNRIHPTKDLGCGGVAAPAPAPTGGCPLN